VNHCQDRIRECWRMSCWNRVSLIIHRHFSRVNESLEIVLACLSRPRALVKGLQGLYLLWLTRSNSMHCVCERNNYSTVQNSKFSVDKISYYRYTSSHEALWSNAVVALQKSSFPYYFRNEFKIHNQCSPMAYPGLRLFKACGSELDGLILPVKFGSLGLNDIKIDKRHYYRIPSDLATASSEIPS